MAGPPVFRHLARLMPLRYRSSGMFGLVRPGGPPAAGTARGGGTDRAREQGLDGPAVAAVGGENWLACQCQGTAERR